MPYKEPAKRTIRLDDDVWEAVRAMPLSLNKFLRKALAVNGAFDLVERAPRDTVRKKFYTPIPKPSEKR